LERTSIEMDVGEAPGSPFGDRVLDYSPWTFWSAASDESKAQQLDFQRRLLASGGAQSLGEECFISDLASVQNEELRLGDRSYIAAGAYLTGSLHAGRDCTINPYAVVRGRVSLGDAVRIGAHTSLLGFNHTMSDQEIEVFRQPITNKGDHRRQRRVDRLAFSRGRRSRDR
jgi:hypothetical protein